MKFKSDLKLIVFYHGSFGERFVANVINYRNSCPSFGACGIDGCVQCKEGIYSFSKNLVATYAMLDPVTMPDFIEDADAFLPKKLPEADIAVVINVHPDVLLAIPEKLAEFGVKAMIVPIEEPRWATPGLVKQLKEKCDEFGLEFAAPKPFCSLYETKQPTIRRFFEEMRLGYPEFRIEIEEDGDYKKISELEVLRSHPCGCAWFVGVRLRDFSFRTVRELWDRVSETHHSYPCTASMEKDNEYNETLLHVAGYITRHAVDKAIGYTGDEEIPKQIEHVVLKE